MLEIKLSESTAARRRVYFVAKDASNPSSPITALTFATTDIKISKNGGATASSAGTVTEVSSSDAPGLYYYEATSGEVDTLGVFILNFKHASMVSQIHTVAIVAMDKFDATRLGLTALPNANANATGGLAAQVVRGATAQAGSGTTITLDASASATDNFYNGLIVYLVGGTGSGQAQLITGYVGSTKVATVAKSWATNPDNTSVFAIVYSHGELEGGAITSAKFASGAITSSAYAAGAITATVIADAAIDRATYAQDALDLFRDLRRNTAQSGSISTTIVLDTGASATDGFYVNDIVTIVGGTGVGQARAITAYTGATKTATISPSWTTTPDNTSVFEIFAESASTGGGGGGLSASDVENAVWNASRASHTTAGTFGEGVVVNSIANNAITASSIASNAITSAKIATDAIGSAQIAADAIGSSELANGAITAAKFAAGAIDATAIANGAIDRATFAQDALDLFREVRRNTAQSGAAGTITLDASASSTDDFYNGDLISIVGGTGSGQTNRIRDYVGSTKVATLARNWITNPDNTSVFVVFGDSSTLEDSAILSTSFSSNSITSTAVAANTIGATQIASGAITNAKFAASAIDSTVLASNAIGASQIASAAITNAKFAASAIDSTAIASGAITSAKFAAGAITATVLADASIDRASFSQDALDLFRDFRRNTAQAGAAGSITLDASASAVNNFYLSNLITIVGGTGVGQARAITAYDGTTKVATISPSWSTTPDNTSVFEIFGAASSLTGAQIAASVWDEPLAGHSTAGTAGRDLSDAASGGSPAAIADAVWDAVAVDHNDPGSMGEQMNNAGGGATPAAIADAVWNEDRASHVGVGTFGEGVIVKSIASDAINAAAVATDAVNKIQSGLATATNLSTANSNISTLLTRVGTPVSSVSADIASVSTKLGTPAGASVSADISAIKSDTASVVSSNTAQTAMLTELHTIGLGRWKIVGNVLTLYNTDGTTALKTFNLLDDTGAPSGTRIFERAPIP
jgi:hypothetical protein